MNKHHYVAIMAGGIGSRFWPSSRVGFPKQFLDVLKMGQSLIQSTYDRYASFIPKNNIFVVTSEEYTDIVREQLPQLDFDNIISEPIRKNTAPCVAYISFKLLKMDPQALLIVAPSDHVILDNVEFRNVSLRALNFVNNIESLVTLGIQPSHPNTGYGYIQHQMLPVAEGVYKAKTFTEKPDVDLARIFLKSGDFLWNGGIFVWPVKTVVRAFEIFQPEMFDLFDSEKLHFNTPNEKEAVERIYPLCANVSIDFAIMEKADNVYIIPCSFGWSDLGTWNSAYDNIQKDFLGNAISGENVLVIDATKCMVSANGDRLMVLQGLDDYIVVDTSDVLMICKKEKEQSIKQFVGAVKRHKGEKYL